MNFRRVLVIKLRAMGDTVLMTASLNALRAALPEACEIHCLAPKPWSALLENHPSVDQLFHWDGKKKTKSLLEWAWKLRQQNYDAVFALHAAGTTAWLARLSGAPVRAVHFHGIHHANRFSTVTIPGKGKVQPILQRDFDTLRSAGFPVTEAKTSINLTTDEKLWANGYLTEHSLRRPLLVLALGASRPTKIWSPEKFAQVAQTWIDEKQGSVMVFVGPGESALVAPFRKIENVHIREGGNLRQGAALIEQAQLFIGNDSGPKHLAVSLGLKTITVFGPESPLEWHPYSLQEHPIAYIKKLGCRKSLAPGLPEWCSLQTCVEEKHKCMEGISVDQVVNLWKQ